MNNEDTLRLNELKLKIWGIVSRRSLNKEKNPLTIEKSSIESHKGRVDKAVRLLGDYLTYAGIKKAPPRSYQKDEASYYVNKFEEESAVLGKAPTFLSTWSQLHDEIYSRYNTGSQDSFDLTGYKAISELSNTAAIYVYWHQDEYDFFKNEKITYIYPVALRETRIIAMMRAVVEHTHQDGFVTKLERYLEIPKESLKREDNYTVRARNFCARAADLTEDRYNGINGFREEYTHYRDYFEALLYNLKKIDDLAKTKGGQAAITREMRKQTITELLEEAPLHINFEQDEEHYSEEYRTNMTRKLSSVFILRNSAYLDYDILYGSDESIQYIENNSSVDGRGEKSPHEYLPDPEETLIIQAATQEYNKCLAKKTSEILQSI